MAPQGQPVPRDELTDLFVASSRALVGIAVRSIGSAPVPVTVSQHRVLVLLAAEGPMTVGEIALLAGVNQSNASRICDRLQKLALVERQRAPDDARMVQVSLTEAGKRNIDSVSAVRRREVGAVLSRLTAAEARAAASALVAFNTAAGERDDQDWWFAST